MDGSLVNAWIFLNEDEPPGTTYDDPTSSYQALVSNKVYESVDVLFVAFFTTTPTGATTTPTGDGTFYTLDMDPVPHGDGTLTNRDYLGYVVRDARAANPGIRICATLGYDDDLLANVFANTSKTPEENATAFAANLLAYLRAHELDGFDIDWEPGLSTTTTQLQFALVVNAVGELFRQQGPTYLFTLSPAWVGNLDGPSVTANMSFVNLQLYSGSTFPSDFENAGVDPALFAYGAKFESVSAGDPAPYQSAEQAFQDNADNYRYPTFTCWRLNSGNFQVEQAQQQELYRLVGQSRG
jgi:glycosyl hydrolase family 18 (putative chitinase)